MPRSYPNTVSPTPKGRVGAGKVSKQLIPANDARDELIFEVNHETAKVWFAFGPEAVVGEGVRLREVDEPLHVKTQAEVSVIADTEGPNEKQTVTIAGAKGGKFTLSYNGKTTAELKLAATKEEVQTALEGLTTIGTGNVGVTGEAGGPWTVEFKGTLKATDAYVLTGDPSKLEDTVEGVPATITVATTVPGGVSVCFVEI